MRWLLLAILATIIAGGVGTGTGGQAEAHGVPMLLTATPDGKLHTNKQTYNTGIFDNLGGQVLETDQPGYSIIDSKQGIALGTQIKINVVDQLLYWQNGVVKLDSAQQLEIDNDLGDFTVINKDTVFVPNFTVETYNTSSVWHEHLNYILLSSSAPVGAYGLLLQVTAPGYQRSDNFLVVFNNGLPSSTFNQAAADLAKAEFQKPGDANGDGLVDGADYTRWADNFNKATTWRNGNFTYDAIVDGADYTIWADNFAPGPLASAAAVPEPSAILLAGVGGGLLLCVVLRKRARRLAFCGRLFEADSPCSRAH
jgi:hypothetical protein